ncbi:MAG: hypothetical protein EZS28_001019 [Streblomastix strix]|uniref:Uncharacterized protein n=1 Tax=Streblomastix strix TaxID=222440 RepID=A0A5J4XAB6_9EUKA|nr:MAG: hypothetical protein EZS28_001019 [Streblomastix strix]
MLMTNFIRVFVVSLCNEGICQREDQDVNEEEDCEVFEGERDDEEQYNEGVDESEITVLDYFNVESKLPAFKRLKTI